MATSSTPWALVTGGAGYVAGAVIQALIARGLDVTVVDDLSTGHAESVPPAATLVVGSVGDRATLDRVLERPGLEAVFHFAGRTAVAESVADPLLYYATNVEQGIVLIRALAANHPGAAFILSSSAGVYGHPPVSPVPEDAPLSPISPYGDTKRVLETILAWCERAYGTRWMALRYFNAAGAAPGIAERHEPESHLIPNILRAAAGGPAVTLFGTDYDTPDGTAVRDYVHILDLCQGHILALDHLTRGGPSMALNLGSGKGASVREVLGAAEAVVGRPVAHVWQGRRPGDPPHLVADISRARSVLGFDPVHSGIDRVVLDAWRYGVHTPAVG
jgi:UDP-glucose 4-epimerase